MLRSSLHLSRLLGLLALCLAVACAASPARSHTRSESTYIVQAQSVEAATAAVTRAGGTVTRSLAIIGGVAATIDGDALARLRAIPGIVLHADSTLWATSLASKKPSKETDTDGALLYPAAATGANAVRSRTVVAPQQNCQNGSITSGPSVQRNLQGWGVTVAVIDSGLMEMQNSNQWNAYDPATGTLFARNSEGRCIVYRDFLPRTAANGNNGSGTSARNSVDQHGHGTHVVSTIVDNRQAVLAPGQAPTAVGVAPKVNLVVARALDKDGAGSYADVIAAIEWVVANRTTYNIRVLNLSIYTPVTGPYWADPLNQAVMRAWQSGIVVVVAAGNDGPDAGTITVPGNVPYVISVGALKSGRYTESGDDELASYSSRGPTESAFVKPDVLVPASRTIAPVPDGSTLYQQFPEASIQERAQVNYGIGQPARQHTYFRLSGTSMAAAEVSGIVALMLQEHPTLTNDQVKYRLLATARPSIAQATGLPAYSLWEQGAGLIDVQQAIMTSTLVLANQGMDINLDLTTDTHYWGLTTWDEASSEFQMVDPVSGQTMVWDGGSRIWSGGSRIWSGGSRIWSGGSRIWSGGSRIWSGGSTTWAGSESFWAGGSRIWSGSTPASSLSTASHAELLVTDSYLMLPAVLR
jgi:serine protease AprX